MLSRRKLFALAPTAAVAAALPANVEAALPPATPDDYTVDWEIDPATDVYVDEFCDKDGFTLEIYDATNKRGYEGEVKWWAVSHEDFANGHRERAYRSGVARAVVPSDDSCCTVDGIVTVQF